LEPGKKRPVKRDFCPGTSTRFFQAIIMMPSAAQANGPMRCGYRKTSRANFSACVIVFFLAHFRERIGNTCALVAAT
jgi:hypothetical protein